MHQLEGFQYATALYLNMGYYTGYFTTPLDIVIITEFIVWL